MKEDTAATVGFFAAPVLPALVLGALTPVTTREAPDLSSAIGLFPAIYPFCGAFAVLFGIPAFLLGRRLGLIRWWSTAIVGFAIGAVAVFIFSYPAPTEFSSVATYALLGGSGLIFWTIWQTGRPRVEN
jgi:membrane associated rhomboid family serine protease